MPLHSHVLASCLPTQLSSSRLWQCRWVYKAYSSDDPGARHRKMRNSLLNGQKNTHFEAKHLRSSQSGSSSCPLEPGVLSLQLMPGACTTQLELTQNKLNTSNREFSSRPRSLMLPVCHSRGLLSKPCSSDWCSLPSQRLTKTTLLLPKGTSSPTRRWRWEYLQKDSFCLPTSHCDHPQLLPHLRD